jgi:hypothetical protein
MAPISGSPVDASVTVPATQVPVTGMCPCARHALATIPVAQITRANLNPFDAFFIMQVLKMRYWLFRQICLLPYGVKAQVDYF